MRLAAVLVFASLFSSAFAVLPPIPTCSEECLVGGTVDYSGCLTTDVACLCKSSAFLTTSGACVERLCIGDQLTAAIIYAEASCAAAGVTLSLSATATATSGASATSAVSGQSAGSPASGEKQSSSKKSHVPIGAIVGGVIGGLFVIGAIGVAVFFLLRRRKTNTGVTANVGEIKYSSVAAQPPGTLPSASFAVTTSTNPFMPTSETNSMYTTTSAMSNPYGQPPTSSMPTQTGVPYNYTPNAAVPIIQEYTSTPATLPNNSYAAPAFTNEYAPMPAPSNPNLSSNNVYTSTTHYPSRLNIPPSSTASSQRVATPSTTYFETSSTIQGHEHGSDTGVSTADAHALPSFTSSASDTPDHIPVGKDNQAQLTGGQLDFVSSLHKANVPHSEILAVMAKMRGQAPDSGADYAPPVYDFKGK